MHLMNIFRAFLTSNASSAVSALAGKPDKLKTAEEWLEELGPRFSPERWAYAGKMTLLGMVTIFAVLSLLWLIISGFSKVMGNRGSAKSAPKESAKPASVPAPAVAPSPVSTPAATQDAALIAVITAAIEAYRSENEPNAIPGGFRVVAFRRKNNAASWNAGK